MQMTNIVVVATVYITISAESHEFHLSHSLDTFFNINTAKVKPFELKI